MKQHKFDQILIILVVGMLMIAASAAIESWVISITGWVDEPTSELRCYTTSGEHHLHSIDWGRMVPGKSYTYNFIVKNEGDITLTLQLYVPTNAWTTGAYGHVSWDREGYSLSGGSSITATLTWQISSISPTNRSLPAFSLLVKGV